MKTIKITGVVSGISNTGVYTIIPLIDRNRILVHKSTGKELGEEEIKDIPSSDIEAKTVLKENSDFWTENPSMNFRLAPDNEDGRKALRAGDVVDIAITKR